MYARRSVNIAEKWALVADGGHGNDAPLADYAGRAGERGLGGDAFNSERLTGCLKSHANSLKRCSSITDGRIRVKFKF